MFMKIGALTFALAIVALVSALTLSATKTGRAALGWERLGSPCKSAKVANISATEDIVAVGCSNGNVYGYFLH